MRIPEWVLKSLFRNKLRFRQTVKCECGTNAGHRLSDPADCTQYTIATCPQCGHQWGIYKGPS